jgi:hypothetical protein
MWRLGGQIDCVVPGFFPRGIRVWPCSRKRRCSHILRPGSVLNMEYRTNGYNCCLVIPKNKYVTNTCELSIVSILQLQIQIHLPTIWLKSSHITSCWSNQIVFCPVSLASCKQFYFFSKWIFKVTGDCGALYDKWWFYGTTVECKS